MGEQGIESRFVYYYWTIRRILADFYKLRKIPQQHCQFKRLASLDSDIVPRLIGSQNFEREWGSLREEMEALLPPRNVFKAVNPGDRRAVYYLLRHFNPASVLEVGTNAGGSTTHIALALRESQKVAPKASRKIDTVDMLDVNDPHSAPWISGSLEFPPATMLEKIGCRGMVSFFHQGSLDYLRNCKKSYDFIFLDGDHSAYTVYQEVALALKLLNPGGTILLHDYFPGMKPFWHEKVVVPGPYIAVRRYQREGVPFEVLPLGELPWKTKSGTNYTSLALLSRKDNG